MALRIDVPRPMLHWAIKRSRRSEEDIHKAVPQLRAWEAGDAKPTLKQLEKFARATHTPLGYLLMDQPPTEGLPIPDFRTIRDIAIADPSPDLLDTIYICEQRQEWYRLYARRHGVAPVAFVGSVDVDSDVGPVAQAMRDTLAFTVQDRQTYSSWSEALRSLIDLVEAAGVMVMVSGIVGGNIRRILDPKEFRGFTLIDDQAPVIFINGTDTKAAQIFTLAHELAHIWLGQSGIDKPEMETIDEEQKVAVSGGSEHASIERWCNGVAAEFLLPAEHVPRDLSGPTLTDDLERIARKFKVSTLVALRRLFDVGIFNWDDYRTAYVDELARVTELGASAGRGGNFYLTQPLRVSRRFARALISDTLEGRTLYKDAFHLLGVRKAETFRNFGEELGVA